MNDLILSYVIYLRDTLFEYNGDLGGMYSNLQILINTGSIKGVISPSSKEYDRVDVIKSMSASISSYLRGRGDIKNDLMSYNDFVSFKRNEKLESIGI